MKKYDFKIHLASHFGMCFGVRDAITKTRDSFGVKGLTILGQLVHNPIVSEELNRNGVQKADLQKPANEIKGTVVITAHGASTKDKKAWESNDRKIIDTTCPLVHKAHQALNQLVASGYFPVVIGKKDHAEVKGLIGDFPQALVVQTDADIPNVPDKKKIGIVSQTTQRIDKVELIVESIRSFRKDSDVKFVDTVCAPTKNRQTSVQELSKRCDLVFVVGGTNSNNTIQLVNTIKEFGSHPIHIQRASDIDPCWLEGYYNVGLTAGTSTLKETVMEVYETLEVISQNKFSNKKEKIVC